MKRYGLPLLLYAILLALIPSSATSTGSLAIPNTIAAQSGPNVAAGLLDTNWTTIRDYVNTREVSSGTLAARPSAGTAGRWYVATDQNGGTTYFDNGSSWVTTGGAVGLTAPYTVRGLAGSTASSTNTTYNVTADLVILRNPSTGDIVAQKATASRSNSILTSAAADGRDTSAAFTPPNWIHFYYIWNGATLSTLSSLCAPSDINGQCSTASGPTLPSGYTHWAYIGAVRMATAGTLNATYARGGKMIPSATQTVVNNMAITVGEQTVSLLNFVPPNAGSFTIYCSHTSNANTGFGAVTGMYTNVSYIATLSGNIMAIELANIAQQFFFAGNATTGNLNCQLQSFTVPNGG